MPDIDTKLTTLETIKALANAGYKVRIERAADGCYEASRTQGKLTETCHGMTLELAIEEVADGLDL